MGIVSKEIEIWKQKGDFNTPLHDSSGFGLSIGVATTKPGDYVLVMENKVWVHHLMDDSGKKLFCRALYDIKFFRANHHLFERVC